MTHLSRPAAAVAALVLSALPCLVSPSSATADTATTKAGIEHVERLAATSDHPSKAQIERQERESATVGGTDSRPVDVPSSPGGSSDPVVWQLALSAAAGAALTGGAVIAGRKVNQQGHAVAH